MTVVFIVGWGLNFQDVMGTDDGVVGSRLGAKLSRCNGNWWLRWCW